MDVPTKQHSGQVATSYPTMPSANYAGSVPSPVQAVPVTHMPQMTSPTNAGPIPVAIPVGYMQPGGVYYPQPGAAMQGPPPAVLVSPGGAYGGPFVGMPAMMQVAPFSYSADEAGPVDKLRVTLQRTGAVLFLLGFLGIIPTATWLMCVLAMLAGAIAMCNFKTMDGVARLASGIGSGPIRPIHAYNICIAIIAFSPINLLYCIILTASRVPYAFSPPPAGTDCSNTGNNARTGKPLECDYFSSSARFNAVTYILGIVWVIVFIGICTVFIRTYNALAIHLRGNAGNTCCCGPAQAAIVGRQENAGGFGGGAPATFIIAQGGSPYMMPSNGAPAQVGITGPSNATIAMRPQMMQANGAPSSQPQVQQGSVGGGGSHMQAAVMSPGAAAVGTNGGTVVFVSGGPQANVI